jgi:hypothetical protein
VDPGEREDRTRWIRDGALWIALLAALVRACAIRGDLAIDEIWSWWFVQNAIARLTDIFALRHDNNHILNTIVMYALGPDVPGIAYRIPAAIASTGAVWCASRIAAWRSGPLAGGTACLLVGASYLMILYGTEARGYAYLVLCAYVSWLCLLRAEADGRRGYAIAFAIAASLGFLAHLTFVYCYVGFLVWTSCQYRSPRFRLLLAAQLLPLATAVSLYLFFMRGMEIGGGRDTTWLSAIAATLSLVAGGPQRGAGASIAASLVAIVLAVAWWREWRRDRAIAATYLAIILLAPATVLLLSGHPLVYPRYFLVPIAFALLVISDWIAGWWSSSRPWRAAVTAVGLLYLVGNGQWTARLLDHGRGDYSRAILWMASRGPDRDQTVGGNHGFRNGMVFDYYGPRLGSAASRLRYLEPRDVPRQGTDWKIVQDFEGDDAPPDAIRDRYGNAYHRDRVFRHHRLTGYNWWLYRRSESSPPEQRRE